MKTPADVKPRVFAAKAECGHVFAASCDEASLQFHMRRFAERMASLGRPLTLRIVPASIADLRSLAANKKCDACRDPESVQL